MDAYKQAQAFLIALMMPYIHIAGMWFEIRALPPRWDTVNRPRRKWFRPRDIEGAIHWLSSECSHREIYVTVLPRLGEDGHAAGVTNAAFLWLDVDGGERGTDGSLELISQANIPPPNIMVASGNGLHCYWRLNEVVNLPDDDARERVKATLRRLCHEVGGKAPEPYADMAATDVARILRVPGTYNHKDADLRRDVRLLNINLDTEVKSLTWWRANLAPELIQYRKVTHSGRPNDVPALPPTTLRRLMAPTLPGQRHQEMLKIACSAARCGYDANAIRLMLSGKACRDNFPMSEVEQMIAWVERRF